MIEARYAWHPPAVRSLGQECIDFWVAAGGTLFEWQELVIEGLLGLGEDGLWASVNDGLCVARQNGKGVILQALELYIAFELGAKHGYRVILHTAHEFSTSQIHQSRLMEFVQDTPHLHAKVKGPRGGYVTANGQESINLRDGTSIKFKARTKGGARGWSADWLVWDEAMVLPDTVVGAQKYTLRASQGEFGAKTIYAGSAVDQEVHEYGLNFSILRARGIDHAPRVSWFEWSAPFDHPSHVTEDDLQNRDYWRAGNPSMAEGLISEQTMEDEIQSSPSRTALVELFGVGDWFDPDGRDQLVISIEEWDRLRDETSQLQEPFCLGFDVSPERRTSIALAGLNQHGRFHTEIQESRPGTSWAVPRIVEMVERGNPSVVVCDSVGPAASLVVPLREAGVNVETVNTQEHGQACGRLVDMVSDGSLAHLGSAELRDAVRGARTRPLGDAWAWSRKHSSVDISPLVAATLALGAAAGVATGELVIW